MYLVYSTHEPSKITQFDSISRDIGQYPMIEISNSGLFKRVMVVSSLKKNPNEPQMKTNKSWQKTIIHLRLRK